MKPPGNTIPVEVNNVRLYKDADGKVRQKEPKK
jgi:hypothetical protein